MVNREVVSNLSFQLHGLEDSIFSLEQDPEADRLVAVSAAIQRYYLWVLAGVGIPANILAILGVLSLGHVLPAALLVLYLSATDAIALLLKLLANQIALHNMYIGRIGCKLEFAVVCFSTLANWILVGIAVNRFLWLRRRRMLRQRRGQVDESGKVNGRLDGTVRGEREAPTCKNTPLNFLFGSLWITDELGLVSFTNKGISRAVFVGSSLLFGGYGAVFFIMRDADVTGHSCGTYGRYVWFWKNVWYYINTGLFFFIPFTVILILTVISVHWLLLEKRTAQTGVQTSKAKEEKDETPKTIEEPTVDDKDGKITENGEQQAKDKDNVIAEQDPTQNPTDNLHDSINKDAPGDEDKGAAQMNEGNKDQESSVQSGETIDTRNQRTLTAMMVLAATFFLFLSLPGCIFYLTHRPTSDAVLRSKWHLFEQIQFILVDGSHALNFFIYFLAVKAFRESLIRLVKCRGKGSYSPQN
ncbi:hypothetical protein PoB_000250100 [Plakobranchus ocellatus]|uniref:G-protein coupled receptors family 1 profile domain-containing protein n=1 Tax=Plakobranchus ocellatus TaxID=259542 RepID=A0AAV3XAA9_9GAST|nr:hypothetical protein PoB_000250100 [Plakobranchus ocellatus]